MPSLIASHVMLSLCLCLTFKKFFVCDQLDILSVIASFFFFFFFN